MNTMQQTAPDDKIVGRVRKLLALANDKGATEAEAQLAAEKAAELMEEYGLEMARVEAGGGETESREKTSMESARGAWYGPLMKAVAESFFCTAFADEYGKRIRFVLIGRKSAVASTQVTYDYLRQTIWRLGREAARQGTEGFNERWFRHGCAERVIERLHERHVRIVREQREQAERAQREAAARGTSSSTALTVVLGDWEQQERDLNEDFRRGVPPGTTARERAERAARTAAREARYEALMAEGLSHDIAWRMAYMGQSREEAEQSEAEAAARRAAQAVAKPRRSSGWTKSDERYYQSKQRREERIERKRSSPAFQAGRSAGEWVGLDQQVGRGTAARKLG